MNAIIPQDATVGAYYDTERHSQSWLILRTGEKVIGGRRFGVAHHDSSYPSAIKEAERLTADRQARELFFQFIIPIQELPQLQEWDSSLFF